MKVYVAHYPKLENRLVNLRKSLINAGFSDEDIIVSNGICRTQITQQHINSLVNHDAAKEMLFRKVVHPLAGSPLLRTTEPAQAYLANFMNHHSIWNSIAHSNDDYSIVLEDDAILAQDFQTLWPKLLSSIPRNLDIAYLNAGCQLTPHTAGIRTSPDTLWYEIPDKRSRTCCSYLIHKNCAASMASTKQYISHVDWEMVFYHRILKHNVYWCHPCPFLEGSDPINGNYPSTVR